MIDLSKYSTFGVSASANSSFDIQQDIDWNKFIELVQEQNNSLLLGQGSNILFVGHYDGLVARVNTRGIWYENENSNTIEVSVAAGENWHQLVQKTLSDGYSGLENLALIPGTVGAAPIQNIGAYGVELKDRLVSVDAFDIVSGTAKTFNNKECDFAYRESRFKRNLGRYFIKRVTLKLDKQFEPNISYAPLADYFSNEKNFGAVDVFDKVIKIRQSKLPDPAQLGNAGSFFKNPIIDRDALAELQSRFDNLPFYELNDIFCKVPAGWLIDKLGLKGFRKGDAGVHKDQALVLVNYGKATGKDVWRLAQKIQSDVFNAYGIQLEPEVRVVTNEIYG